MASINATNYEKSSDLLRWEQELKDKKSKIEPLRYKIDEMDHRIKTTAGEHTKKNLERQLNSWKKELSEINDRIDVLKRLIDNENKKLH